jgi:L-ascorbate metabolism protein UlaG (beta-lactamase superfamily)
VDLTWLGHSSVVIDVAGVRLLTDPLLLRHNRPLRRRGPAPARIAWERPDAVLVSHLHLDHAELASLRLLPGVPVLTAPVNAAWLRRRGVTAAAGIGESWQRVGGSGQQGVAVRLVRAEHGHRRMPHRPNAANGHLVRAPGVTIWVAGDTGLHDGLADLPGIAGGAVDVAIVPIAGWGPRLSRGHLDAESAARACAVTGARWAVPVHWGTLHAPFASRVPRGWMDAPGERFARAVRRYAAGCTPVVLRLGERRSLPP